jgi:uncharacterized protein (UPF0218 family)
LPTEFLIDDRIRKELKIPLGRLIEDSKVTKNLLKEYFEDQKITVCVGDRTTERVQDFGFSPSLEIVDSLEKRASRKEPKVSQNDRIILEATNPPGLITKDSLERLAECLRFIQTHKVVRLQIRGEEDLLALPVVAFFPGESVLFYGQPNEGLVVVSSSQARERAKEILQEIGINSLAARE